MSFLPNEDRTGKRYDERSEIHAKIRQLEEKLGPLVNRGEDWLMEEDALGLNLFFVTPFVDPKFNEVLVKKLGRSPKGIQTRMQKIAAHYEGVWFQVEAAYRKGLRIDRSKEDFTQHDVYILRQATRQEWGFAYGAITEELGLSYVAKVLARPIVKVRGFLEAVVVCQFDRRDEPIFKMLSNFRERELERVKDMSDVKLGHAANPNLEHYYDALPHHHVFKLT